MIIDTHAHLDDKAFDEDRDQIIHSLTENGIGIVVNSGASMRGVYDTVALMDKYSQIYGTLGIHPDCTKELNQDTFLELKQLCKMEKCIAVGEIGLDYHYPDTDKDDQKNWFIRQLEMAAELKLPVVIHSRDAASDTMDILKEHCETSNGGVMHCFSYSKEIAAELIKMNFYFGIGGVVTFKNARKLVEVVEMLPMNRILLETDSPYLAPEPNRGRRNSSLQLPHIVKKISEIKNITEEEVIYQTELNARSLYYKLN